MTIKSKIVFLIAQDLITQNNLMSQTLYFSNSSEEYLTVIRIARNIHTTPFYITNIISCITMILKRGASLVCCCFILKLVTNQTLHETKDLVKCVTRMSDIITTLFEKRNMLKQG